MKNIIPAIQAVFGVIVIGAVWVAIPILGLLLAILGAIVVSFHVKKEHNKITNQPEKPPY